MRRLIFLVILWVVRWNEPNGNAGCSVEDLYCGEIERSQVFDSREAADAFARSLEVMEKKGVRIETLEQFHAGTDIRMMETLKMEAQVQ